MRTRVKEFLFSTIEKLIDDNVIVVDTSVAIDTKYQTMVEVGVALPMVNAVENEMGIVKFLSDKDNCIINSIVSRRAKARADTDYFFIRQTRNVIVNIQILDLNGDLNAEINTKIFAKLYE